MTANKLKIIACISMLIDHIGFLLFPRVTWLRWIGRLAMPLFAWFIGEGCRYTKNRKKYFLQVFCLALFCQAVYLVNDLLSGGIRLVPLNILFTFSLSIPLCYCLLDYRKAPESNANRHRLIGMLLLCCLANGVCYCSSSLFGVNISIDYWLPGIILPAWVVLYEDRTKKLVSFSLGLFIFCAALCSELSYIWFSLLTLPLLFLYNGQRGKAKLKYLFYIFYPLHLAALYGISILI